MGGKIWVEILRRVQREFSEVEARCQPAPIRTRPATRRAACTTVAGTLVSGSWPAKISQPRPRHLAFAVLEQVKAEIARALGFSQVVTRPLNPWPRRSRLANFEHGPRGPQVADRQRTGLFFGIRGQR